MAKNVDIETLDLWQSDNVKIFEEICLQWTKTEGCEEFSEYGCKLWFTGGSRILHLKESKEHSITALIAQVHKEKWQIHFIKINSI